MKSLILERILNKKDFNNISLLELYLLFDINKTLKEDYKKEDRFKYLAYASWLIVKQHLINYFLRKTNNPNITLNVLGIKLIVHLVFDNDYQYAGLYQNNNIWLKIYIDNIQNLDDAEVLLRSNFNHEFRHFMQDIEAKNDYKKNGLHFIKNVNNLYSYYNSPIEFDAMEAGFFDLIRKESKYEDIEKYRGENDTFDEYLNRRALFDYIVSEMIPQIKKDKNLPFNDFFNHLNEKNLKKFYKDLNEYLLGSSGMKFTFANFKNMPRRGITNSNKDNK